MGSRVAHVRELKAEVSSLRKENDGLRRENAELRAHFDLAVAAARDLDGLPPEGRLHIWDGWNLILGADRDARDREDLVEQAKNHLRRSPSDRVWIVLDGPHESSVELEGGRLRISYTGGTGLHRADRLICDFVRMSKLCGLHERIIVRTHDRDFLRQLKNFGLQNMI